MAVIDVAGFVADLKSQAIDHGFHVHDERHFVETYSLRQLWEVDLHPEEACSGPIDLHLSLDVDPRAMLGFEDEVMKLDDLDESPPAGFTFPLVFTWTLPPLPEPPDLLVLATELAGIGGVAGRRGGPALLRQHGVAGLVEQRHGRPVGDEVDRVLARTLARWAPIGGAGEQATDLVGDVVEEAQGRVAHAGDGSVAVVRSGRDWHGEGACGRH